MPADILIMGTSHPLQCGSSDCSEESVQTFESELKGLLDKYGIKRIAEEMTSDGLRKHKVSETIAQRVARERGIAYQAIDLSGGEREMLSLDEEPLFKAMSSFRIEEGGPFRQAFDDLADGVRERVWIARILSQEHWPVFLICGSEHTVSVRRLWRRMGFDSKIIHIDYEP